MLSNYVQAVLENTKSQFSMHTYGCNIRLPIPNIRLHIPNIRHSQGQNVQDEVVSSADSNFQCS